MTYNKRRYHTDPTFRRGRIRSATEARQKRIAKDPHGYALSQRLYYLKQCANNKYPVHRKPIDDELERKGQLPHGLTFRQPIKKE